MGIMISRSYKYRTALISLVILVQAAVAAVSPYFSWSQGPRSIYGDVDLYSSYASRAIGGEIPYRDYTVEYPIGAFPLFLLPKLIARSDSAYRFLFGFEMFLCNVAAVLLVARQVRRAQGPVLVPARLGWYTLAFTSLCPLLVGRFDLAPTVVAFAASCAWASGRRGLGGSLAGVGALTKVFPGFSMAPFLIREIYDPGPHHARGSAGFLLTVLALFSIWLMIGRDGLASSFYVHGRRGFEIESVSAGLALALSKLAKINILIIDNFGSSNLYFEHYEIVLSIIPGIQFGALFLVAWVYLTRGRGDEFRYAAAALFAFLITGKVLSPQYLIWLLPFVAVLDGRAGAMVRPAFLISCVLTRLIYPGPGFLGLLSCRGWAIALLNGRNALLIYCLYVLLSDHESERGSVASKA